MKSFAFTVILVSLISFNISGQEKTNSIVPVDETSGKIEYQEVVHVEGSKEDLFNRCISWVNNFYVNPVAVTQVRDLKSGVVEGRHQLRIHYMEEGYEKDAGLVMYNFKIEFKEGRYRYTITDFVLKKATRYPAENWMDKTDPLYNPQWDEYLRQIDAYAKDLIADLKEKMQPEPEKEEDDW